MSSEIAIRVQNLSKCHHIYDAPRDRLKQFVVPRLQRMVGQLPKQYFREFWALKDVSFEIKKGEAVGIIGRNGSGKSTLLQMICGTLNLNTVGNDFEINTIKSSVSHNFGNNLKYIFFESCAYQDNNDTEKEGQWRTACV